MSEKPFLSLRAVHGTSPEQVWSFAAAFRVGRDSSAELGLTEAGSVSGLHASVQPDGNGWWVTDLGSTHGTCLNGAPVGNEPAGPLRRADRLRFGGVELLVQSAWPSGQPRTPGEPEPPHYTTCLLQRYNDGDPRALNDLIGHVRERLLVLTEQMLRGYPSVRTQVEADDVLQEALPRLTRALAAKPPESSLHFYRLACQQIRWELLDLTRRYRGRCGQRPLELTGQGGSGSGEGPFTNLPADSDGAPSMDDWAAFHEAVKRLPEEEREVVNCIFYLSHSREETAEALGISLRTVGRRWQSARLMLDRWLRGDPGGEEGKA
jgi:RNA polymerase sigma factor (sigma-70 family)